MIARAIYRLQSYLARKRLERDPEWRRINRAERNAKRAHQASRAFAMAKRERIHTALGWRGM